MRQEEKQDFGDMVGERSAVIWVNDYHDPKTVNRCKAHAMAAGCAVIMVKNSAAWDWDETERFVHCDVCYTNLPKIARLYESQKVEIQDIDDVPQIGAIDTAENDRLKAEIEALKKNRKQAA